MNRSGKNVLIVDPSHTVTRMLSTLLCGHGFNVHIAKCGHEALGIMERKPVDWLCFAYELGDMDGIELFVRTRSRKLLHHQVGCMVTADLRRQVIKNWMDDDFRQRYSCQRSSGDPATTHIPCADVHTGNMEVLQYYRQILESLGLKVCISVVRTASESLGKKTLMPILAISSFENMVCLHRN